MILSKILNIALIILIVGLIGNYVYRLPKFSKAQLAPTFELEGLNNNSVKFDTSNSDYVLLHFWATWCAPCMKKLPVLSKLYSDQVNRFYEDSSSFRIVSIVLDTDSIRLNEVIQKYNIIWTDHIMESNAFDGDITKLYGVRKIPTMYLIGRNNEIILVNPDVEKIAEFLNSKVIKKT